MIDKQKFLVEIYKHCNGKYRRTFKIFFNICEWNRRERKRCVKNYRIRLMIKKRQLKNHVTYSWFGYKMLKAGENIKNIQNILHAACYTHKKRR